MLGTLNPTTLPALRAERIHHVSDRAVLARRIDPLEDHEQGMPCLGPQALLEPRQLDLVLGLVCRRILRLPAVRLIGIEMIEVDLRARRDPQPVAQLVLATCRHRVSPPIAQEVPSLRGAG